MLRINQSINSSKRARFYLIEEINKRQKQKEQQEEEGKEQNAVNAIEKDIALLESQLKEKKKLLAKEEKKRWVNRK